MKTKCPIPIVSSGEALDYISFMTHGMNSIYIILDLLFVAGVPVRLYHIIHPALVAVVYVIFNIIYDVTGGKLIDMIEIMTEILETFR